MRDAANRTKPSLPSRRQFFSRMSDGLHGAALAYLFAGDLFSVSPLLAAASKPQAHLDLAPKAPHFEPHAKAFIQLFMNGGPSQVGLFDPQQDLAKYAGKTPSSDLTAVTVSPSQNAGILPSPYKFSKRGQGGMELSD